MRAYLSLGTNMGNRKLYLEDAIRRLEDIGGITIVKASRIYETEPWGVRDQPKFLNQVVEIDTTLEPMELLRACQDIEAALGRKRMIRWGPRTIDIDILLYDNRVSNTPDLLLPHPRMEERAFVLIPLREIAPTLILPSGRSIQTVAGEGQVRLFDAQ